MPRAKEAFISLHTDPSVHHPSLLLTQIPVPPLVLPVPVGRSLVRLTHRVPRGLQRPSFRTPEPGGRQEWPGGLKEEGGGRAAMWSFWCLLAWFPALPASHPGLRKCLEEIVPGLLGLAQYLPLDPLQSPTCASRESAAAAMLFHQSWTSVVKDGGGIPLEEARHPEESVKINTFDTEGSTEADEAGARSQALGAKLCPCRPGEWGSHREARRVSLVVSRMTWALVVASSLGQRAQTEERGWRGLTVPWCQLPGHSEEAGCWSSTAGIVQGARGHVLGAGAGMKMSRLTSGNCSFTVPPQLLVLLLGPGSL